MSTGWVADTHVHLYPDYDLGRLFCAAARNLRALATRPEDRLALFLTERAGHHMFDGLQQGNLPLPESIKVVSNAETLHVHVGGEELVVLPGRQIVTRDRLEVLSLTVDDEIPDGGELEEVLQYVRDVEGVPVLPWSPGKWRGERGKNVLAQIKRAEPGQLFIGDILMRPRSVPEPAALRLARERGLTLLAGSDPLPLPNEEDRVGRYGVRLEGETLRDALANASIVGERQRLVAAGLRWARQQRRSAG